ncbi:MAG: hypothetical protein EOO17_02390 [Chloroflexi bacterium]|nr:MAG: hypothetical protein EOO17_02390 [Chloroflexota bacterium]
MGRISALHANIAEQNTDVIVNAANTSLFGGSGVAGAIFDAAGYDKMTEACKKFGHCETGEAVITPGFGLPAKYVIHAVGPVYGQNNGNLRLSMWRSTLLMDILATIPIAVLLTLCSVHFQTRTKYSSNQCSIIHSIEPKECSLD